MPSMIPTSQLGSMPLSVQVRNMGYETVSGTASFNLLGETVAQEKFTDLAPGDTIYVDLTVNIAETELPTGSGTTETVVAIDGHDDGDPSNNVMPLPLEVTGDTYAYDYMTDDFYTDNGIGAEAGKANLGIVFRIYEETKLKAISLGWGIVTGQDFNMYVYKWDPTGQPDANGNLPLGEQIATASGTQPAEIGQYEYPLDEPLTLEPGYYMISAEYEGFGLAADRIPPGQLYEIGNFNGDGVLVAYDASIAGLGTPAIRAVLDGETTGIETVTDGAESKVQVTCDGSTLNVTATDGSLLAQAQQFVSEHVLLEHLGDTCEIIVFLLGAMTIVEVVDQNRVGAYGILACASRRLHGTDGAERRTRGQRELVGLPFTYLAQIPVVSLQQGIAFEGRLVWLEQAFGVGVRIGYEQHVAFAARRHQIHNAHEDDRRLGQLARP